MSDETEEVESFDEEIIYLDYNATTPVDPEVTDVVMPFLFQHFGNPSSSYAIGQHAKDAVETARAHVATLINCTSDEVCFTSCATESINLAIKGAALAARGENQSCDHIITCVTEHPAVLEVCRYMRSIGFTVTELEVDEFGIVSESDLVSAIIPGRTALISLMYANNETGTVQDITGLRAAARRVSPSTLFHTDASQACGKMTVDCRALNVDLLTMASHKMGAPKNAGVLFVRDTVVVQPILHGASQEHGRRAGTENVIMIVGLGAACALATQHLSRTYRHMQRLRDRLHDRIVAALTQRRGDAAQLIRVNGHLSSRLPNTLSIGFRGCAASNLIKRLSSRVACSAGAACHSKVGHDLSDSTSTVTVSHVLKAMRVPLEFAAGTLRFSVGKMTDENEIDTAAELIVDAVCAELQ